MPIGVRSSRKFGYGLKETAPALAADSHRKLAAQERQSFSAAQSRSAVCGVVNQAVNGTEVPPLLLDTCAYYSLELGDSIAVHVSLVSPLQDGPELIGDGSLAPSASVSGSAAVDEPAPECRQR